MEYELSEIFTLDMVTVSRCNKLWQSRVEIEHYSIAYFERITAFKAL